MMILFSCLFYVYSLVIVSAVIALSDSVITARCDSATFTLSKVQNHSISLLYQTYITYTLYIKYIKYIRYTSNRDIPYI